MAEDNDHKRIMETIERELSVDEAMRVLARALDHTLRDMFRERQYFILLTSKFGGKGKEASFISNGQREDSIAALEELLERIKDQDYFPPTIGNA